MKNYMYGFFLLAKTLSAQSNMALLTTEECQEVHM